MDKWYCLPGDEVCRSFESSVYGLTEAEADRRLIKYGKNGLKEAGRQKTWQVFLEQFKDLLVVILLVAAMISLFSDNVESTVVIFAVLLLNAILGTVQHEKAEKSLDSLRAMSSPAAHVLRGGCRVEIPSAMVVPGDILLLEAGDLAAADGRLLECHMLKTDESSLTGESEPVEKWIRPLTGQEVPLAEQRNMVFSGSLVTSGRGVAVVTATGMFTEIGRIAELMNDTGEKKTPLQISLDEFSGRLAAGILFICVIILGLSLYRGMGLLEAVMFAVALAVAAIPEALSSIVTIVQAMGTQKMAKEHAIVKDLKAVESLGCVSVICSDKTGTLTRNRMTVQQIYTTAGTVLPGQLTLWHPVYRYLLYAALLDNDAAPAGQISEMMGDPTETALLEMGMQAGIRVEELRREMPRLAELPFDSERKRMSTLHMDDGVPVMFCKGAMDELLARSDYVAAVSGIRPITAADRQHFTEQNLRLSAQGLRVLAFAYKKYGEMSVQEVRRREFAAESPAGAADVANGAERELIFLGIAAMMDPPRAEARAAVAQAKRAGIRTVMITGDHKVTAMAVAEKIGIFSQGDLALTGQELDKLEEREFQELLPGISVYARVSPEHKIRIVDAWQRCGRIVAMTGDGVNDAPALKKADIGVAMGIMGTEVSKDAAAMILTDDNFATIMKAVANGRNVYRNIRHAIQFLLSGNAAGIFCVLYTSLFALPLPFAPVHLLFINLLTDSLPAIAIGMEPQEEGLLDGPPRSPDEGILTGRILAAILGQGALIAACTMLAYGTGRRTGNAGVASTMAFATLTLARLFHGFNCRSRCSILRIGLRSNPYSIMACEAGVILLAAVLFLPGLQVLFAVADLSLRQLLTIVIFAAVPTIGIQAWKTLREAMQ